MSDAPYLTAVQGAVPTGFLIRHAYTDTGLHDLVDGIRTELAHVGQWRPLITAIETVVASQPGMKFVTGFPPEDRAHAANLLASIVCTHAGLEIRRRLEVLATRR